LEFDGHKGTTIQSCYCCIHGNTQASSETWYAVIHPTQGLTQEQGMTCSGGNGCFHPITDREQSNAKAGWKQMLGSWEIGETESIHIANYQYCFDHSYK
jgi:hypothetical protein